MAKRNFGPATLTYPCQLCKVSCTEHPDRPRAVCLLCGPCFEARFAKGLADQRRADAKAVASG